MNNDYLNILGLLILPFAMLIVAIGFIVLQIKYLASELAIAIMGTNILANIQRRTLGESVRERLTDDEVLKRNMEYFKQWLESEVRE